VLAAASLSEAFRAIGTDYERESGESVLFSFAGSQTLATQLRNGVTADVIATANTEIMQVLYKDKLILRPEVFASNELVWLVRRGGVAGNSENLGELIASPIKLVLAAPEVPAGRYARQALREQGLLASAEQRLVSQELDVKSVLSKLRFSGADAGAVYATDIGPALDAEFRAIPSAAKIRVQYPIARVRNSPRPSQAEGFVGFVRGPRGQQHLRMQGFGQP
jgi:molybdate transport system substrate-binding protein